METEKKRTLKGSILFTVVSVLALMTIFMTSALALAAAANKRAHKTYSASQASYTARAAIDSILAAVGTNNEFANAVEKLPQNGSFEVEVGINSPSLGRIDSATVEYEGKTTIFDNNTMVWVEKNLIKITAEVTMGGETTKIVSHVIQDPVVKHDDGPGFLTMGGADAANGNNGSIFGGAYYGMGHGYNGGTWNANLTYIEWNPYDGKLTTLEDKMYLTNEQYSLKDINRVEALMVVNGNFDLPTYLTMHYTQLGQGLQIWGDLNMKNGGLTISMSDPLINEMASRSLRFNETPYLYVDGKITMANQDFKFGDGTFPFNIFCGSLDLENGALASYADIYCYDKTETTRISTNSTNLYSWSNSLIDGGDGYSSSGGGIFSKGNLEFSGNHSNGDAIGGDIKVEGNVAINKEITIDGDLVVGGKLSLNNDNIKVNGKVYADSFEGRKISMPGGGELKDGYEKKDISFIIAKDVAFEAVDPDDPDGSIIEHVDYMWIYPEALEYFAGYTQLTNDDGTPTNAYDFGGAVIPADYLLLDRWDEAFDNLEAPPGWGEPGHGGPDEGRPGEGGPDEGGRPDDGPPDAPHEPEEFVPDLNMKKNFRVGFFDPAGNEVTEAEAMKPVVPTYNGNKDTFEIYPLSEYYTSTGEGTIFPAYAEKATILGLSGPVKGTEGHFGTVTPQEAYDRVYNGTVQLVGHVTESCTLTGSFTKPVTVDANGKDVYVHIKDAVFRNDDNPAEARIYVNEANGGHVYFTFEGEIECFYDNEAEKQESQVIQTVFEVMDKWKIETNVQAPQGEITNVVTAANAENKVVTIDGVDAKLTGMFDGITINVIPPATDTIWIQLDGFKTQNGARIVINDIGADGSQIGGTVNFYVTGTDNEMRNGQIVTQSFLNFANSSKTVQVVSDLNDPILRVKDPVTGQDYPFLEAPRVNMYSAKGAKFSGVNEFFITAFIRAPYMDFNVPTLSTAFDNCLSRIYYDGIRLDKAGNKNGQGPARFGILGCLNVASHDAQNDWLLVYVKDSSGGGAVLDANKQHTYAAVSYLDY